MDIFDVLRIFESTTPITGFLDSMFSMSAAILALVLAMALFGTNLVNNLMRRNSAFEYVFTLTMLFFGGLLANILIKDVSLPINNEIVIAAIVTNIGLILSAFVLIVVYRVMETT